MTGITLRVEFNDAPLQQVFRSLIASGVNMRPLMAEISEGLLRSTNERFDAAIAPDGTPWEALKPATLVAKAKRGQSAAPLKGTGDLQGRTVPDYAADYAGLSINRVDAALHQFGGTDDMPPGPAGVPARPILGFSEEDLREIQDAATDYLKDAAVNP